jgi:hypothetical protein
MAKIVWFQTCPVCRRRFPVAYVLRNWRSDYSLIDFPLQSAVSLGCRGFSVLEYISWKRLDETPALVNESFSIFVQRIVNTYEFLKALGLLSPDEYTTAYSKDDIAVAYDYGRRLDRD